MSPPALQALPDALAGVSAWLASLPDWQAFLVLVGTSVLAAAVVQVGGDVLLRRVTARIPGEVDDVVFGKVHAALWVTVLVAGPYLGLSRLGALNGLAAPLGALALTVVVLAWAYTLLRIGPPIVEAVTDSRYVDGQVRPIVQNVWSAVVLGGTLFVALAIWEVDVTPLLASAGILGIVIGLAARDTIANFFGSIALYADGTYAVGDYVVLESGERGRVEDVSIRSTVVRTRDDVLVTVPNAVLNNAAIVNESAPRTFRRVRIPVSVAYGTAVDDVEELMLEVAAGTDLVRERPAPRVRLREFGDSGLRVELLCWIDDPRLRGRARDTLLREIYEAFREADVEIPYPQRDLRLRENGEAAVAGPALDRAADAGSKGS